MVPRPKSLHRPNKKVIGLAFKQRRSGERGERDDIIIELTRTRVFSPPPSPSFSLPRRRRRPRINPPQRGQQRRGHAAPGNNRALPSPSLAGFVRRMNYSNSLLPPSHPEPRELPLDEQLCLGTKRASEQREANTRFASL